MNAPFRKLRMLLESASGTYISTLIAQEPLERCTTTDFINKSGGARIDYPGAATLIFVQMGEPLQFQASFQKQLHQLP